MGSSDEQLLYCDNVQLSPKTAQITQSILNLGHGQDSKQGRKYSEMMVTKEDMAGETWGTDPMKTCSG